MNSNKNNLFSKIAIGLIALGTLHFIGKDMVLHELGFYNKSNQLKISKINKEKIMYKIREYKTKYKFMRDYAIELETINSDYKDSLQNWIDESKGLSLEYHDRLLHAMKDSISNTIKINGLEKELEDINNKSNWSWLHYLKY